MRALVTGATGRVGSRLVDRLLGEDVDVRALVMPGDPFVSRLDDRPVDIVEADLGDAAALRSAVREADWIVHLAAVMDWTGAAAHTTFVPNVGGTVSLLQAVVDADIPVARVFLASSDEVYPSLEAKIAPIPEDHPQEPWSFYGLTKQMCEQAAWYYHRAHRVPVTVARFALIAEAQEILSPTGWSGRFLFLSSMRGILEGLGNTAAVAALDASGPIDDRTLLLPRDEQGRSYEFQICDVRDLVEGILAMLREEAAVGEAFNLSGPASFAFEEAVEHLHHQAGIPFRDLRLPGDPIRVSHSIEKARGLLGYQPRYDIRTIIDSAIDREEVRA